MYSDCSRSSDVSKSRTGLLPSVSAQCVMKIVFCFSTPFRHTPVIDGREIDLYKLYWVVTAQGGFEKVSKCFNSLRQPLLTHGMPTRIPRELARSV